MDPGGVKDGDVYIGLFHQQGNLRAAQDHALGALRLELGDDFQEGLAAALEKRTPAFTGR